MMSIMLPKLLHFLFTIGIHHRLRRYKHGQLTILCLHRISEDNDYFFDPIRPEAFRKLLAYVSEHYTITTFAEYETVRSSKPLLILSFDDGYYDFIEHALPILHEFKLPSNHNLVNACLHGNFVIWTQRLNALFNHFKASEIGLDPTIYAVSGARLVGDNWHSYYLSIFRYMLGISMEEKMHLITRLENTYGIEASYRMMSWADAQTLVANNVEIGCHTYTHDSLNQVSDPAILKYEIEVSRTELSERLNQKIEIIALPNGQYSQQAIAHCKLAGFKYILLPDIDRPAIERMSKRLNTRILPCIPLNNESLPQMILRTERIQPILKGMVGRKQ